MSCLTNNGYNVSKDIALWRQTHTICTGVDTVGITNTVCAKNYSRPNKSMHIVTEKHESMCIVVQLTSNVNVHVNKYDTILVSQHRI